MWSYGIDTSGVKCDWGVLKKNRDAYILRLNHIYTDMLQSNKVELIKGFGKFIDNYTVECQGNRYTADHILIATGSRPCTPNIEGIKYAITSDGFFELENLPKRVILWGGGYIGVEMGQILHGFGSKVVHLVRGKLLNFLDEEIR